MSQQSSCKSLPMLSPIIGGGAKQASKPLREDFHTKSIQHKNATEKNNNEGRINIGKINLQRPKSRRLAGTDSQEKTFPSTVPTNSANESMSEEYLLIPRNAVTDDVNLKFILHPNLDYSGTSLCNTDERRILPGTKMHSKYEIKDVNRNNRMSPQSSTKKSTASKGASFTSSGEQYVAKTAKEILYDIAHGRWSRSMVIDEETEGTKKVGLKQCSNANCVRAEERERVKKEKDFTSNNGVFEDGNLPSYHSLLSMWRHEEDDKQRNNIWMQNVFKNGFPENENEFLKVWRECRKNPQALGIQVSQPKELPDRIEGSQWSRRVVKVAKLFDKNVQRKAVERPPIRLASKEYYDPEWEPVTNFQERSQQKRRYYELRKLYPHLPILKDIDFTMNPATVKYRMRQAEEWHKLVTASNRPTPITVPRHCAADINYNSGANTTDYELYTESAESSELELETCGEDLGLVTGTESG